MFLQTEIALTEPVLTEDLKPKTAPEKSGALLRFRFSKNIAALADDWDSAAAAENFFLQRPYLTVLEQNPPNQMGFGYLVFYKNERPVGVAYCQIKHFKADTNIRDGVDDKISDICFFDALLKWMRRRFAGMVEADILICGNMLLTGENAFYFDRTEVSTENAMKSLDEGLVFAMSEYEKEGLKIPVILHKELFDQNREIGQAHWVKNSFVEFQIQPNMILDIRWKNFDDYLAAMNKKYRTRTKRAFTKKNGIVAKAMNLDAMIAHQSRMYELYREIARNAGFNMVDLNADYLINLKRNLPEHFNCFGYFLDDKLIAFFTTIKNGHELEAHFLGLDQSVNHEHQVYHNILYDIVREGIEGGFEKVVFARTALEIKSSVGAVAHEMHCYLKHQNQFANLFTERALDFLKPVEKWEPRHPFAAE